MTKIAFIAYRDWAIKIFKIIAKKNPEKFLLLTPNKKLLPKKKNLIKNYVINPKDNLKIFKILKKNKIKIVFYYGWSWMVSDIITKDFLCLCLHPSRLPEFRGGSPIQHQILQGKKVSAVTIFKMNKKLDGGDIYNQIQFSLNGSLNIIFKRIIKIGAKITNDLLKDYQKMKLKFYKQKDNQKIYKRRKANHSKISLKRFESKSFRYFYNFVRMLQDPYPNPYFELNKRRIYIFKVKKAKIKSKKFKDSLKHLSIKKGLYIKLKDSYAKIISGKIILLK